MSVLSDLREKVAAQIGGKTIYPCFAIVPEKFVAPAVFVGPGAPYVTREGMAFGGEEVRLSVSVVAARGVNETRAAELDRMLEDVLDVLYALEGFDTGDVERPGALSLNSHAHLATSIAVTTQIHR